MSIQSRQPAGTPTGGQFATGARTETTTSLPGTPAGLRAELAVVTHVTFDATGQEPLPQWPAGIDRPQVSWEYDDGQVQTTFWFSSGERARYWTAGDETHSTINEWAEPVAALEADEDGLAEDWMTEVHNRIESEAYGVAVATQTPEVNQAVIAAALGEAQPTARRSETEGALARAHAMVAAFNPRAASLDFEHEPGDRRPALRDMLTDLRYLAEHYGIDFDDVAATSGDAYEEERDLRAVEAARV